MRDGGVQRHMVDNRMDWTFNIDRVPWWGGFFESLVRSMKRCLRKVTGRSKLSYDEFITVLAEVESILNSRHLLSGPRRTTDSFTPGGRSTVAQLTR